MMLRRVASAVALAAAAACSREPAADARDTTYATVSRTRAVEMARGFVQRHPAVAAAVHLDSVDVAEGEGLWHVMFRRRALVVPAVVTVDVDRQTGAMRFPGDE
jgi:hypothetical protein